MCEQRDQGAPLITCAIFQFLLDGLQIIVQAIELRVLTAPQRLILIKGGETNWSTVTSWSLVRFMETSSWDCHVGLKMPRSRLSIDIPASPACGYS
jgi:hypothetical protein